MTTKMKAEAEDRKPKSAPAKGEAVGNRVELTWRGRPYSIDRENADNIEALEAVQDGKYFAAIRLYLGLDQWAAWKDHARDKQGRVRSAEFESFSQAIMDAIGGQGNS